MAYSKADLINELSLIRGYRTYLEICAPTTGNIYGAIDRARYACHRLMYRCPETFNDGMPVDLRSQDLDITECAAAIRARGATYDAILVEPFHEYEPCARDLGVALELLSRGGTIVVHDCFPRDEAIVVPHFIEGAWCGVTYKAYLDFVLARKELSYCTVGTDYGCGVIRLNGGEHSSTPMAQRAPDRLPEDQGQVG